MDVASGSNYSHLARVKAWPYATMSTFYCGRLQAVGFCIQKPKSVSYWNEYQIPEATQQNRYWMHVGCNIPLAHLPGIEIDGRVRCAKAL